MISRKSGMFLADSLVALYKTHNATLMTAHLIESICPDKDKEKKKQQLYIYIYIYIHIHTHTHKRTH